MLKFKSFDCPENASKYAAGIYEELLTAKPDAVLGFATGSTPLMLYGELSRLEKEGKVSFANAKTFNLDEYWGMSGTEPQSYRRFMDENLFEHISIPRENTRVPSGITNNYDTMCAEYESAIEKAGGVDLQLLGIGHDGHIGFNEPCTYFPNITHVVELTQQTRDANSRFFNSVNEVPTRAITMGIGTIMRAKKIVFLAFGKEKQEITRKALRGLVDPQVPASILQFHPDVTVLTDFDV